MPPVQAASTHVNTLVYQGDPTWWIIWCRWSRSVARFSPLMPTSTIFPLLCRLFTAVLLWYAEVVHHRWLQHPDQPESSGPLQFNHPQDWHHECRDQDGAASASQTKTPGPECIDSFWFLKLDWPNWSYTSVQNPPPPPPHSYLNGPILCFHLSVFRISWATNTEHWKHYRPIPTDATAPSVQHHFLSPSALCSI